MHTDHESTETGCSDCSGCPTQDRPVGGEPEGPLLVGWRLGLASMGLFLGPVVLAILGAMWSGRSHEARFLGAITGLGIGMAGSVAVAKLLRRDKKAP